MAEELELAHAKDTFGDVEHQSEAFEGAEQMLLVLGGRS